MTTTLDKATSVEAAGSRRRGLLRRSRTRVVETLVVIGNGMAGYKLCERLVALRGLQRFRIVVFGEEPHPAYDRVHLTRFLAGASAGELQLAPKEWYEDHGIELRLADPVVAIDRDGRRVQSAGGCEVIYDRLVFATGSKPFMPQLEGSGLPGVFVYRALEDLQRIRAHAAECRRAAVLGGGLLGLEAAHALRALGLQVWVVERGTTLLARQLNPEAGALLQTQVVKLGIQVCTQRESERIEELGKDRLLRFSTGECLRVQLIVIAAGVRPRDELAAACGLKLGSRGGIEIDDGLRTSDPRVFAIGECATHRGKLFGLAAPAYMMADALAAKLAGRGGGFVGADQSTWLKLPGLAVAALGDFQANGETLTARTHGTYRRLILDQGRLVGAVGVGDWPEQARLHEAIEHRRRVWRWQRGRFTRLGRLWSGAAPRSVGEWPARAIICNCMGVRRAVLSEACEQGCRTVEQLAQRTGASTVCGSCRPLLADLVGAIGRPGRVPGARWLLTASVATLVVTGLIALAPAIPFANTVQGGPYLDVLWRGAVWKRVTGFTLVGLALASLLFSLRKRVKAVQVGKVSVWRAVHASLGALTLVTLVAHTGFRLGHNLNFVLAISFLSLALAGGLAAGVTALENRFAGPAARRLRAVWTAVHFALVWPLPALVLFHVLAAYYF